MIKITVMIYITLKHTLLNVPGFFKGFKIISLYNFIRLNDLLRG